MHSTCELEGVIEHIKEMYVCTCIDVCMNMCGCNVHVHVCTWMCVHALDFELTSECMCMTNWYILLVKIMGMVKRNLFLKEKT